MRCVWSLASCLWPRAESKSDGRDECASSCSWDSLSDVACRCLTYDSSWARSSLGSGQSARITSKINQHERGFEKALSERYRRDGVEIGDVVFPKKRPEMVSFCSLIADQKSICFLEKKEILFKKLLQFAYINGYIWADRKRPTSSSKCQ